MRALLFNATLLRWKAGGLTNAADISRPWAVYLHSGPADEDVLRPWIVGLPNRLGTVNFWNISATPRDYCPRDSIAERLSAVQAVRHAPIPDQR